MDSNRFTAEKVDSEQVNVTCSTGINRRKTKILTVKLSGPKEMFFLTDALSRFGSFPSVEEFVSDKVRSSLSEYLERAEEVVNKASELTKSSKISK